MKSNKEIIVLKNLKIAMKGLYEEYLIQSGSNNCKNCIHDDSGGHPDYHCDQHDNTPVRTMIKKRNAKNEIY